MKFKIIVIAILLFNINTSSQNSLKESWSFGAGLSNFMMNGDLKAGDSFFNLGAYVYADKMISPSIGFELKFGYNKLSGKGNDSSYSIYGTTLDNTKFEGTAVSGETNVIYNISNLFSSLHKHENRKFNFSILAGIGVHKYDSKLYNINTNELLADFGNGPSKNGTTTSFYYTTGLNLKYKLTNNLELEFIQNFNFNEEDHLDAAVSNKSSLDYFLKSNIGIVYSLNKKENKNFAWYDQSDINIEEKQPFHKEDLADSDNDGVIDIYDIEKNTPKGAVVYGNGVAIDSDNDGVIDLHDKCPLEFAETTTGCKKNLDSDKDGIIDSEDECPNEYAKSLTGCKKDIDTDKDGVIDTKDECPTTFAQTLNGCPKKKSKSFEKEKVETPKAETPVIAKVELKKETIHKRKIITEINKKNVSHGNTELDNSVNINDVDVSPVYPGCADKTSQYDITNCIISSISKYVDLNYNK
ncbi:MAG TPA: hypothetical protein EYG85_03625, partial [Crocinitomix sp.]|nr:hypothetical protein [Crocinitomix sp.]